MSHAEQHMQPWIIRTYAGFGSAEDTNARYHQNLRNGQKGLSVAFDLPTQNGYDPDHPLARGEIGRCGVNIAHAGDTEKLFDGIDLASINTSMTINATAPFILALYLVLAERKGIPWNVLRGTVQNDMMKEFVARGTNIFAPSHSLRFTTDLIAFTAEHVPQWNPINVCGYHYTESGARPHEEIGYTFGNALMILDTLRPSLPKQAFTTIVERISFFINSGLELVPEICKVRAYSRLWTELCRTEYGIEDVRFRAGCQVRSLGLPAVQPENNIIRIALEALPVLLSANARVNALQLPGFREALSLPDRMEQLLSLRTQQILMHETKITEYADIFDGNTVIEHLTSSITDKARSLALEIRTMRYDDAIVRISRELTAAMVERQKRIDSKEDVVVGMNEFLEPVGLSDHLPHPQSPAHDDGFEQRRIAELAHWKRNRDVSLLSAAIRQISVAVQHGSNILPPTLAFARAGGTVGEWTEAIAQATYGRFDMPLNLNSAGGATPSGSYKGLRIVLGKAGLDGHNNAIKLLAIACRNAGMEVIFGGTRITPERLVRICVEEDADVLAVSSLSGSHATIAQDLLGHRKASGVCGLRIVMGGIIPPVDVRRLLDMGIDLVIPTGNATISEIVQQIGSLGLKRDARLPM